MNDVSPATEYVEQVAADNDRLAAELAAANARIAELEAKAEKWKDAGFRRQQPALAYIGLDIAARDLAADREAFAKEVARRGAALSGEQS